VFCGWVSWVGSVGVPLCGGAGYPKLLLRLLRRCVPHKASVTELYAGAGIVGISLAATRECRWGGGRSWGRDHGLSRVVALLLPRKMTVLYCAVCGSDAFAVLYYPV